MIDVYVVDETFEQAQAGELLARLTEALLRWTDAAEIPLARDNAGAFLHRLPSTSVMAGGRPAKVARIDVRLPEVVLSTIERRAGFIRDANEIVQGLSGADGDRIRTWVTVSNTVDGGWGMNGHALTNADLDDL